MKLSALNVPAVANAGAALVMTSASAFGTHVLAIVSGARVNVALLVACAVGMVLGAALAYVGQPSGIPPRT